MTVNELMDQHNKVLRAKADMNDINFLYPENDGGVGSSLRETFFDGAFKRYIEQVKIMKEMMAQATPEVLAEAKTKAKAERDAAQKPAEDM